MENKPLKPHVNVGTLGHVDHGRSTLTAAIVAVQCRYHQLNEVSLPILNNLESNWWPEQTITFVVKPTQIDPVFDLTAKAFTGSIRSLDLCCKRVVPDWNHSYPPGPKELKKL